MRELVLRDDDRLLVLAPHPDDETLAAGGVIGEAIRRGLPVRVVFFTNGDSNVWSFMVYRKRPVLKPSSVLRMGRLRREEALAAGGKLGLRAEDLVFLGYPDYGTVKILLEHWRDRPPLESETTRADRVPYEHARTFGAPYSGESILRDLEAVIAEFRPTKIFVSHPFDHNHDHRTLYVFTRVALWDLAGEVNPELWPCLVHFERWPQPRGMHPDLPLLPPGELENRAEWYRFPLDGEAVRAKEAALECHRSQLSYARKYLEAFVRTNELFGRISDVSIAAPAAASPRAEGSGDAGVSLGTGWDLGGAPAGEEPETVAPVEVLRHSVLLEDDRLRLTVRYRRRVSDEPFWIELFGYRKGVPFAEMPKIRVRVHGTGCRAYDLGRRLPKGSVEAERVPDGIRISVPLAVLGRPDRIITSCRSYHDRIALDWTPWRILWLKEPPK